MLVDDGGPVKLVDGVFTDVATAKVEPPKWVIKNVLPTGVTFVAGPPKGQKTTFVMSLAATAANIPNGGLPPFMSEADEQGQVLVFSAEHSAGEIRHLLESGMGCTIPVDERFLVAEDPWSFRLDTPDGLARLLYWLDEIKPVMFVLDPLRNFHDADENDSGEMYALLRKPREWAKENDAAFVVLHHTSKPGAETDGVYRPLNMRGTSAIFGMADAVHMLSPQQGAVLVDSTFKRSQGSQRRCVFGVWGATATEILDNKDKSVLQLVRNCPSSDAGVIALQLNLASGTVLAALEKLARNGYVRRAGTLWLPVIEGT